MPWEDHEGRGGFPAYERAVDEPDMRTPGEGRRTEAVEEASGTSDPPWGKG